MDKRNSRNRDSEGVELIRIRPHDTEMDLERRRMARNRAERMRTERERQERRRRKKRQRMQKRMTLMSTVVCTVLLLFGGVHFVKANVLPAALENGNADEILGESQPQEILGPVPLSSNEILEKEENSGHEKAFIVIDPGHGGTDTGCDREGVMESEVNMQIANRLAGKLQGLGFETLLLREDNATDVSLEERVERAESERADIFVSIHQNAYDEDVDDIKGIETWYYGDAEGSRRLAELVHRGAVEKTGAVDRGIQNNQELYVLKYTSMPACLIETAFLSSRSDRNNIITGEYQDKVAEGIAQGIQAYFNPKTMYLTFDDGPSEENTSAVLDILKERNIKATFFVVGENVRKHPDVAKRIVEEGHTIGIHCNNHDYKQLYKSVDSYLEDFQKAYDTVYEITGVEAKLFRFPGGSVNAYNKAVGAEIIQKMTDNGYIYFDWNASLEDAVKQSTPEALIQNAVTSTLGRKKVVMLAHDVIYNTAQCLEELIDSFPEYEMKPLTVDVEPIQF